MNVSFPLLSNPKCIPGRWILVPFGDTVSQSNVLSFARINVVSNWGGGATDPRPVRLCPSVERFGTSGLATSQTI